MESNHAWAGAFVVIRGREVRATLSSLMRARGGAELTGRARANGRGGSFEDDELRLGVSPGNF